MKKFRIYLHAEDWAFGEFELEADTFILNDSGVLLFYKGDHSITTFGQDAWVEVLSFEDNRKIINKFINKPQ